MHELDNNWHLTLEKKERYISSKTRAPGTTVKDGLISWKSAPDYTITSDTYVYHDISHKSQPKE